MNNASINQEQVNEPLNSTPFYKIDNGLTSAKKATYPPAKKIAYPAATKKAYPPAKELISHIAN